MSRLDRWLGGGLRTVMLPSGEVFRLKIPDVEEMLSKGMIPPALRQIALKFGAAGVNPETMDSEGLAELLTFMRTLVATSLRYLWDADGTTDMRWQDAEFSGEPWQPVTITLGMLEEGSIDGDDYAALQGIVSREFTTNQITAIAMHDLKLIEQSEFEAAIEGEKGGTTIDWQSFRGKRRGAAAGESGGSVEGPPVRDHRRATGKRRNARVPARRRAEPSADRG